MAEEVPVREGLFEATPGGPRLLGGRCGSCGQHHFPLLGTCPYCSASAVEAATLSPAGTLWAWTAVTTPPPGYRGEVPYGFGVVELPEGLRVVSRLSESDPGRLRFGQAMQLELVPLHRDEEGRKVVTWSFTPSEGSA